MKIPTSGPDGKSNGYLLTIWSGLENPELRPDQVYLTALAPHSRKGPHLHKLRRECFVCIRGNVRVAMRMPGIPTLRVEMSGENHQYRRVVVPPGRPSALYNDGEEEALVLVLAAPAWAEDARDEWPVEEWPE